MSAESHDINTNIPVRKGYIILVLTAMNYGRKSYTNKTKLPKHGFVKKRYQRYVMKDI